MGPSPNGGSDSAAPFDLLFQRSRPTYIPEYDTPQDNNGVARGLDYEDSHRFGLALQRGGFHLSYSTRQRLKGTPTASYDTVFDAPARVLFR